MNTEVMLPTSAPNSAEQKPPSFGPEIELFTKHVDSISDVLMGMVLALQSMNTKAKDSLTKFESEKCEVTEAGEERTVFIPNDQFRQWRRLNRRNEHYLLSRKLLPRSLLVSLISQYDAFLGRVLRTIFLRKPEILNGSDKKISFESLSQFSSLDAARDYILEKEVESILRSSHADQFKWMERTFDLHLTKDLVIWPAFIEITERRNLFVHTDGIVSSQYISVCGMYKSKIDEGVKEGDNLGVPQKYFESSYECIHELGVKLGHVLWRKLFPDEREMADDNLINHTYELIDSGKYRLAIRLLDFACSEIKKFANESNQLVLVVNRALAYKCNGDDDRCMKVMRAVDWSAKGDQFKLADAVLSSAWERAAQVMKRIGKEGPVSKSQYRDWPLFREWREQKLFLTTYAEVFGEEFVIKTEVKSKEAISAPLQGESPVAAQAG